MKQYGPKSRLEKNVTDSGHYGIRRFILIPVFIICIILVIFVIAKIQNRNNAYSQIANIRKYVKNGELNDFSNQIGMKDPDTDIRWYKDGDDIEIVFGYMDMHFTTEEFFSDYCKQQLGSIGITYKLIGYEDKETKETRYKIRMFYNGKELERWVTS